ncbi:DUF6771 family protein [Sphingomonas pollutisoli]|uniref:DUF6771 family protein n=1 Tax=Sphingomonas pollutisoli TaxID=3030829 RepID=UPI0030B82929
MSRVAPNSALVSTAMDAIATAPGWARVGLTFGNERLREAALAELATAVAERLENPEVPPDPNQLRLAL